MENDELTREDPNGFLEAQDRLVRAVLGGLIYAALAWMLAAAVFFPGWLGIVPQVWLVGGAAAAAVVSLVLNRHAWQVIALGYLTVGAVLWAGASFMLPPSQFREAPGWQTLTLAYIVTGIASERIFRLRAPNAADKLLGAAAAGVSLLAAWMAFNHLEPASQRTAGGAIVAWLGLIAWRHEHSRRRFPGNPTP